MWLSSMCAINQALKNESIDVGLAGESIQEQINIPMNESYFLVLIQNRDIQHRLSSYVCEKVSKDEIEKSPNEEFGAIPKMSIAVHTHADYGFTHILIWFHPQRSYGFTHPDVPTPQCLRGFAASFRTLTRARL